MLRNLWDAPAALEAACPPTATLGASARSPSKVPTADLYESANNPRTEIPDVGLDELADEIRRHGISQPIVVHRDDREGHIVCTAALVKDDEASGCRRDLCCQGRTATAEALSGDEGKVKCFEGTPIPTSLVLVMFVAATHGGFDDRHRVRPA